MNAAICGVCLKDRPPTALTNPDSVLFFLGTINCRKRLAEPYCSDRLAYPGHCIAWSAMPIPLSTCLPTPTSACPISKVDRVAEEKATLLKTTEAMKKEYVKQSRYSSLLAIFPELMEMMLAGIRQSGTLVPKYLTSSLSSGSFPLTFCSLFF